MLVKRHGKHCGRVGTRIPILAVDLVAAVGLEPTTYGYES
jgi:hypothetical protein